MLSRKKPLAHRVEGCLLFSALVFSLCEPAGAHSGDPNKLFGADGTMQWPLTTSLRSTQPVAVDHLNRAIYGMGTPSGDIIGALKADGSIDSSFGSGGKVTLDEFVADLAIDSHNRIVVAESSGSFAPLSTTVEIARYQSDGTPDLSFGTGGQIVLSSSAYNYDAAAIAVDDNDNVYVAGSALDKKSGSGSKIFAAKIDSTGIPDSTFGTGSIVLVDSGGMGLNTSAASTVIVDSKGEVFVGGDSTLSTRLGLSTVVKLKPDGQLDISFGGTGVMQFDATPTEPGAHFNGTLGLAIDRAGNVVAAGVVGDFSSNEVATVTRILPNGSMDSMFNGGVPELLKNGSDSMAAAPTVLIDGRDRIVVTGPAVDSGGVAHFSAFRFNVDGTPDSTFGDGAGYRVLTDPVANISGRSAFSHGGDILIFGAIEDSTAITASELIGYDIPPIIPPGGFFRRTLPTHVPSFRPAVQLP